MISDLQLKSVEVIESWPEIAPGYNVQKSILKMTGIDFGPLRNPQENMPHDLEMKLGTALKALGLNITDEYVLPAQPESFLF